MPRTFSQLAEKVYSFDNLDQAFNEVRQGKRFNREILLFRENYEENLINLQNHLIWESWRPHGYRSFTIYEPKMRQISAPCVEDRIVHHALCRVVEPLFDSKMIYSSYACRKGKGMLAAAQRIKHYLRQQPEETVWYLKIDIHKFFHSIDHKVIKGQIRRVIQDQWVLRLMDRIIDSYYPGIPIGALTSQMLANVVLNSLDHYMTDHCAVRYYARYMDDICIISTDPEYLDKVFWVMETYIKNVLHLELNWSKSMIKVAEYRYTDSRPVLDAGIDFCGYRVHRWYMEPRRRNVRAAKHRFSKLAKEVDSGRIPEEKLAASVMSFTGYMKHCRWNKYARQAIKSANFEHVVPLR